VIESTRVRGFEATTSVPQTVTSAGDDVQPIIDGVLLRRTPTHADERGDLSEIYDERWGFTPDAVTFAYFVTVRPGAVRGWALHLEQDDRLFFGIGTLKVALYDAREDSPTLGLVNVFFLGSHDRGLLRIPPGVYHAVKNVGNVDAVFVNLPSQPYRHDNPDKRRADVGGAAIPYRI
jgi:dTDP-4-dehydrorhamnose 3,5-epimerase